MRCAAFAATSLQTMKKKASAHHAEREAISGAFDIAWSDAKPNKTANNHTVSVGALIWNSTRKESGFNAAIIAMANTFIGITILEYLTNAKFTVREDCDTSLRRKHESASRFPNHYLMTKLLLRDVSISRQTSMPSGAKANVPIVSKLKETWMTVVQ